MDQSSPFDRDCLLDNLYDWISSHAPWRVKEVKQLLDVPLNPMTITRRTKKSCLERACEIVMLSADKHIGHPSEPAKQVFVEVCQAAALFEKVSFYNAFFDIDKIHSQRVAPLVFLARMIKQACSERRKVRSLFQWQKVRTDVIPFALTQVLKLNQMYPSDYPTV